MEPDTRYR